MTSGYKYTYFGGPLDGETFDAADQASAVFPGSEGARRQIKDCKDIALPIAIEMADGRYVPDYTSDPPRLIWHSVA